MLIFKVSRKVFPTVLLITELVLTTPKVELVPARLGTQWETPFTAVCVSGIKVVRHVFV